MRKSFDRETRNLAILSIAALTALFLYLSLFILPMTPRLIESDAFINFEDARRMSTGQTLYGDIFQYTLPGTELLELALIKIFGPKVAVINGLVLIAGVADVVLAVTLASSILGGWDTILAGLFFLCFGYHCGLGASHHVFSVALVYAAAAAMLWKRDPARLIAAGILIGLATCFTQTRGLVALAVSAFLYWENKSKPQRDRNLLRDELYLLLPFAIIVGLACAYVVWNGGWRHFYNYIIKFPFQHYPKGLANNWATAFSDWFPTIRGIAQWALIKLLVPGALVGFWIYCWKTKRTSEDQPPAEAILLAVIGSALLTTIFYGPLHVRVAEISLPSIALSIWMLRKFGWTLWRVPAWSAVAAFLILAPLSTQSRRYWYCAGRAGYIAVSDPDLAKELTWLDLHTRPGDSFFYPSQPMLYVLLDLHNPARVPFVEPDDYTPLRQAKRTALRVHYAQPRFILWPFPDDANDPSDHLYPIGEELRTYYHPILLLRDGEVWERKSDAHSN